MSKRETFKTTAASWVLSDKSDPILRGQRIDIVITFGKGFRLPGTNRIV